MNQQPRINLTGALFSALMFLLAFNFISRGCAPSSVPEIAFSDFMAAVEKGEIAEVVVEGQNINGKYKNGNAFRTYAPHDPDLIKTLRSKNVKISAEPPKKAPWYFVLLVNWFPMLLLIGVWVFFMGRMQMGGGKVMQFGKSRAKLLNENQHRVTFQDVAGVDEAKEELQEIIQFLKDPPKFTRLGGRIPKGCLLVGPPGTGKTLLARAVAGEANVPFFSISGSDFVEMFVGVGASRVRDLFVEGKKRAPCIIFIDEIDAVGRHRGAGLGVGHDEREQTLNQLLVEMDGFDANEGVIIIAATNRPDILDPALLRPGRFDRRVIVSQPDVKGREEILKVHARKVPLAEGVSLEVLARGTPGFAGADLENMVNEAALLAARENKNLVGMDEFERAKDKIMMGSERKSMIISEEEKRVTAYHEAGHTLIAKMLPGTDPVHKVTIIPRGMALGLTQQLPLEEKHAYSKDYLTNQLTVLYGGRTAEEFILGKEKMTTGAGNDIERATEIAHKMVCAWGMSDKMGPLTYGKKEREIFLGRDFTQMKDYSEHTAQEIDAEIKALLLRCYKVASHIIEEKRSVLEALARKLLEKETLDGAEIDAIIAAAQKPPC